MAASLCAAAAVGGCGPSPEREINTTRPNISTSDLLLCLDQAGLEGDAHEDLITGIDRVDSILRSSAPRNLRGDVELTLGKRAQPGPAQIGGGDQAVNAVFLAWDDAAIARAEEARAERDLAGLRGHRFRMVRRVDNVTVHLFGERAPMGDEEAAIDRCLRESHTSN